MLNMNMDILIGLIRIDLWIWINSWIWWYLKRSTSYLLTINTNFDEIKVIWHGDKKIDTLIEYEWMMIFYERNER